MQKPILQGSAFLEDVRAAQRESSQFHVWWLGQSGFLIQWRGNHLLLDPYLSDSLTKKYANTDKPHVRMTQLVVEPTRLDFIDVVTSSHNHTDHLDAETLKPLLQVNNNLPLIIPEANRIFVSDRLHCDPTYPIGLTDSTSTTSAGFKITGVPAAHNELDVDEDGFNKYLGYVVEFGPWVIYHSGDTLPYEGMIERLSSWKIDLALLPINGNRPERRVAGNLDGKEAVALARSADIAMVIPCHYDMFTFNTESPDLFVAEAKRCNQPYCVLQNGERWSSPPTTVPT